MKNKKVFVSCEMPKEVEEQFGILGYGCVRLPSFDVLDTPVSAHPDMLLFRLPDGKILTDGRYYEKNSALLNESGADIVTSKRMLGGKYPFDIAFDALVYNNCVIGKTDFTAPEILQSYPDNLKVNQGYAKCSVLLAGNVAVTSDKGLASALDGLGVKTLLIKPGTVSLPGYGCGFIGGASFYDEDSNTVVLFGDPGSDTDYVDFLKENGINVIYPENIPVTDLGGAVRAS